jgi:2-polyprenyl-3-methyl-5-hydroxy-6-metoxy-1,4-benzoquinol methylase
LAPERRQVIVAAMSSRQLRFPANIYATALELAYGRAEFTGYGLAEESADDSPVAVNATQRKVADLLLARLPAAAPLRILEAGCGLGTLAIEMAQAGHMVTAISGDSAEIELLHTAGGSNLHAHHIPFEAFSSSRKFDVIIFHNSAHYIKSLTLLTRCRQLLAAGGQLLISDEFVLDNSQIEPVVIPVLKDFLQLAQRLSFQVSEQITFGKEVAACIDTFLPLLNKHQPQLIERCQTPVAQLQELHAALVLSSRKFLSGYHVYALLDLRYGSLPDIDEEIFGDINSFKPGEVKQLFERSFNTQFDEKVWAWKYGNGRGRAVCIRQHGNIVAHYGGAPRDILYFGNAHKAIQICDVMVLPEKRSFFSKDGLFFRSAATFLEQEVGNSAEHLLGIGFPNIKAMHISERLGLYEKTDELVEVVYPAVDLSIPAECTQQQLNAEIFDPQDTSNQLKVNQLWGRMRAEYQDAVIGLRDWDYLNYRYFNYPHARYKYYQVLDAERQLIGLLVLREQGGSLLLMDLISRPGDMPAVIETCHRLLTHHAETDMLLRSWITRAQAHKLMTAGATVHELQIEIPCNRWSQGPATETLTGAWWLTAGDMDFM